MAVLPEDGPFPRWFTRVIVSTAIGCALTVVGQLVAGAWWAATISAKVDSIESITQQVVGQQKESIDELEQDLRDLRVEHTDDVKTIEDKIANLKRDLAVVIDRNPRGN